MVFKLFVNVQKGSTQSDLNNRLVFSRRTAVGLFTSLAEGHGAL